MYRVWVEELEEGGEGGEEVLRGVLKRRQLKAEAWRKEEDMIKKLGMYLQQGVDLKKAGAEAGTTKAREWEEDAYNKIKTLTLTVDSITVMMGYDGLVRSGKKPVEIKTMTFTKEETTLAIANNNDMKRKWDGKGEVTPTEKDQFNSSHIWKYQPCSTRFRKMLFKCEKYYLIINYTIGGWYGRLFCVGTKGLLGYIESGPPYFLYYKKDNSKTLDPYGSYKIKDGKQVGVGGWQRGERTQVPVGVSFT